MGVRNLWHGKRGEPTFQLFKGMSLRFILDNRHTQLYDNSRDGDVCHGLVHIHLLHEGLVLKGG